MANKKKKPVPPIETPIPTAEELMGGKPKKTLSLVIALFDEAADRAYAIEATQEQVTAIAEIIGGEPKVYPSMVYVPVSLSPIPFLGEPVEQDSK